MFRIISMNIVPVLNGMSTLDIVEQRQAWAQTSRKDEPFKFEIISAIDNFLITRPDFIEDLPALDDSSDTDKE